MIYRNHREPCLEMWPVLAEVLTDQALRHHVVLGDPSIADALLDRVAHTAHKMVFRGESMRKRVFISSTYSDLADHRKAAGDALERLGVQLARMEPSPARPDEPERASPDEVEASELFVGIYAQRYGHVPPGGTVSITGS
jgi:hypothetical protein